MSKTSMVGRKPFGCCCEVGVGVRMGVSGCEKLAVAGVGVSDLGWVSAGELARVLTALVVGVASGVVVLRWRMVLRVVGGGGSWIGGGWLVPPVCGFRGDRRRWCCQ